MATIFDGGEVTETGYVFVVVESRWWLNQKCVWTLGLKRKKKWQFSALDVNN